MYAPYTVRHCVSTKEWTGRPIDIVVKLLSVFDVAEGCGGHI